MAAGTKRRSWTWKLLGEETLRIYGEKYDVSLNDRDTIIRSYSIIKIQCTIHKCMFEKSVTAFINAKSICPGCKTAKGSEKWTWERFNTQIVEVYKKKFDLSKATPEIAENTKSLIPVICKTCGYYWEHSIRNILRHTLECPSCTGRLPWTLERLKTETKRVHGDKFDISQVTDDHIKFAKTVIPIKCNTCGDDIDKTINHFINRGHGCPRCSGRKPWTKEEFIRVVEIKFPEKYDLSGIPEPMHGATEHFPVTCKNCGYHWMTNVARLYYNGTGCQNCSCRQVRWTYDRFVDIMNKFYPEEFDISGVKPTDVINGDSIVTVICKDCGDSRNTPVKEFTHRIIKCPVCKGLKRPWTLERLLYDIKPVFDSIYDFSNVRAEHISNSFSRIPVTCRKCKFEWRPKIFSIIHRDTGTTCLRCNNHEFWTYDRLIAENDRLYPDLYDLSNVDKDSKMTSKSKIDIICKKCNFTWESTPNCFIYNVVKCRNCSGSFGERLCINILDRARLIYKCQIGLDTLPRKRFDFMFTFRGKRYIIEYDGLQHFCFIPYFHKTMENFIERQDCDVTKTKCALSEDYYVIRIDYTNIDNASITKHLNNAMRQLNENNRVYYSDPNLYTYISDKLEEVPSNEACSSSCDVGELVEI